MRPTRVEKDADGWDAHIHFSRDDMPKELPLDLAESHITCLAQIKGTANQSSEPVPVTISNWLKLAECPLPTFFIIVQFKDLTPNPQVEAVKVVHVGRELISRTKKRAATLGSAKANKATMGVPWAAEATLHEPYGESIRAEILRHIGPSLRDYTVRKQRWLADVGYEDGHRMQVTMQTRADMLDGEDVDRAMAEFAVKIRQSLPVKIVDMRDLRFGLSRPHDPHGVVGRDGASMSSSEVPPLGHASYEVYFPHVDERVHLEGDIYVSHLYFPFLPPDSLMSRCVGECFEIVSTSNRIDIRVTFPDDKGAKIDVTKAAPAARCLRFAAEGGDIKFSVILRSPGQPDEQMGVGFGKVSGCKIPDFRFLALEGANHLFEVTQVAPGERFLYVHNLDAYGEWLARLVVMLGGLKPVTQEVRLTNTLSPEGTQTGGVTLNIKMNLGNMVIVAILLLHGTIDPRATETNEVLIPEAQASLVRSWAFYRDVPDDFSIGDEVRAFRAAQDIVDRVFSTDDKAEE